MSEQPPHPLFEVADIRDVQLWDDPRQYGPMEFQFEAVEDGPFALTEDDMAYFVPWVEREIGREDLKSARVLMRCHDPIANAVARVGGYVILGR